MYTLKISPLASSGAILQYGENSYIWGRSKIGSLVRVVFLEKEYKTAADENGRWAVHLQNVPLGGPYVLQVESEGEKIESRDLYGGEVWLCSGQSNMEMPMERVYDEYYDEWNQCNPLIRQFKVPQEWDFTGAREDLSGGEWTAASEQTLNQFSAAGWFFATYRRKSKDVPIGLIHAALGGAPIEAFMSREALSNFPEKIKESERYAQDGFLQEAQKNAADAILAWESGLKEKDIGLKENWFAGRFNEEGWRDIELPGVFAKEDGLKDFCGVLWLRKTVNLTEEYAGKDAKLWLGTIVDSDDAYWNGVKTGSTDYRYPPRKYSIPGNLMKSGENEIVIRVVCRGGLGEITPDKPFKVFLPKNKAGGESVAEMDLSGVWRYKTGAKMEAERPREFFPQWEPCGLYNAMIAPVIKTSLRGVLWYQGEANAEKPDRLRYGTFFSKMVKDWRQKNGDLQLPFLFVQLPLFGPPSGDSEDSPWAAIRACQEASLAIPSTGMAVALDLGEWNDLHPLNKKALGFRLALAAATLEGENNGSPGPLVSGFNIQDKSLTIFFKNCDGGLMALGAAYVSAVCADGKITRLEAKVLRENAISIDLSRVENCKKILYAQADNPGSIALYAKNALPAPPFKLELNFTT
ncbi:MAG: sialate O-acetylesterase [Spirochaetaceae bacterium]|jgi:sialate O-acetylesterase|nr:sialate O-acetylesterase [Spirochaetaceae bacterium]